ncbi:MAG: cohesin domain-containing protein [Candidatus Paceibacterota bacterium]|jgi:hypothetical protein
MYIKKILKNKIFFIRTILFFIFVFSSCLYTEAAILKINSNVSTLSVGDTATISVFLNSEGFAVNNVEAVLQYPTDMLDVLSVSKSSSIFSLWVEDPAFSNNSGTITFNGGLPTPGYSGSQGLVVTFVVKAKKAGSANISFSSAAARANDGLGTDVLNSKTGKTLTINESLKPVVEETKPTTPTTTQTSTSIQITSTSHPDQDSWYKDNTPTFKWNIPSGANAVQTTIDNNTSGVPHVTYSPAIDSKTVDKVKDGVWYFKVRARKDGVWGSTSKYIVRVDTVAPQLKSTSFDYDDKSKILSINVDAQDSTSGIDHYDVIINNVLIKSISAKDFVNGKYSLPFSNSGSNKVKLVVYDKAGNSVESDTSSFESTSSIAPKLNDIPSLVSANENLIVSGSIQSANTNLLVKFRKDEGQEIILEVKSNANGDFLVLLPKLESGNYEIWAESINGAQSEHINTKAISQTIVTIGSYSFTLLYLIIVVLVLMILSFYFGHYLTIKLRPRRRQRSRPLSARRDHSRTLSLLKKNLERHLEILQNIRHDRLLTKEEREMKENIEGGLDEIDQVLLKGDNK